MELGRPSVHPRFHSITHRTGTLRNDHFSLRAACGLRSRIIRALSGTDGAIPPYPPLHHGGVLMRTTLVALFCFSAALAAAQDVKIDRNGDSPVEAKFAPNGRVRMGLCPAGIELLGTDEPALRVTYHPDRDDVRVRME